MKLRTNFCVFILTYGRPDAVHTISMLSKGGYTGPYRLICSTDDEKLDEYKKLHGDKVIVFDKMDIVKRFDRCDNFSNNKSVVFARNACFEIAKDLGYDYFLECDDDYMSIDWRYMDHRGKKLISRRVKSLDVVFEAMLQFLDASGALTVALAQGGDFLGGANSPYATEPLIRKAMNTFFCKTANRFEFRGTLNEDVNTYTSLSHVGKLFFTFMMANAVQRETQRSAGGMTDIYLDEGTYTKSFYSVMLCPSAVKIGAMGESHARIHHRIAWNNCAPKILNEKWKKK